MAHQPQTDPLLRRRRLPAGAETHYRVMRDGWPLRALRWAGTSSDRETILIVTGRGDFIEKYAEAIHDLVDAGWSVATFDWRGQGLSRRVGKTPQHGASPGFDLWLGDLAEMVEWAGDGAAVKVIAHSMGGHLVLRHLAAQSGEGGTIARAVLLSPMTGLTARPLGPAITAHVARWQVARGRGDDFVWGGRPYAPGGAGQARQRWLTNSVERYDDERWWVGQFPALAIGSVTWGWLNDGFASIAALAAPGVPEAIAVPTLFLIPDRDALVDSAATRRLAARIAGAQVHEYPGAGHELLREVADCRADVMSRILTFFGHDQ